MAVSSAQLVTYPNGAVVPADEPAVAAAKLAHAQAGGVINPVVAGLPYAYAGYPYAGYPYAYAAKYPYAVYAVGGFAAYPNGAVVPDEEPAVAATGGVVAPSGCFCLCWTSIHCWTCCPP